MTMYDIPSEVSSAVIQRANIHNRRTQKFSHVLVSARIDVTSGEDVRLQRDEELTKKRVTNRPAPPYPHIRIIKIRKLSTRKFVLYFSAKYKKSRLH
jgi:hypothetical protein